jgi:hypothetical protein
MPGIAAGYRGGMSSRLSGRQLGLFDNPVGALLPASLFGEGSMINGHALW